MIVVTSGNGRRNHKYVRPLKFNDVMSAGRAHQKLMRMRTYDNFCSTRSCVSG